eukprot:COSAG05_NODE_6917_length_881_cov_2.297954_2_plen_138_part_00
MVRKKLTPRISVGGKAKMETVGQGESKTMMVRVSRTPNATAYYTISAVNEGDGSTARWQDLRLSSRAHVQTRPLACPIAGRTPLGVGDAIWRQADSAPGREVDCPTILWTVLCCGHPSTATHARGRACIQMHRSTND